jgi:hypothetical protein
MESAEGRKIIAELFAGFKIFNYLCTRKQETTIAVP